MSEIKHLTFSGQLIVWCARRWVAMPERWNRIEAELAGPLGRETGPTLADALHHLFAVIAAGTQRVIRFGPLNCRRVWQDETILVGAILFAQHGNHAMTAQVLAGMLAPTAVRTALPAVESVATLLASAGYSLSPVDAPIQTALTVRQSVDPGARLLH